MRKYQNNPKVINFYKVCRWGREGFAGSTRDVALRAQHGMSVAAVCLHPPSVCEGGVEPTACQGDGERTRACVCARARVRFYLCARAHLPSLVCTSALTRARRRCKSMSGMVAGQLEKKGEAQR